MNFLTRRLLQAWSTCYYMFVTCYTRHNANSLLVVVKGKGKAVAKDVLKGPEVCKDPVKLTSYAVGANIFKQGEDPQLKPKEEYPAWYGNVNLITV